MTLNDENLSFEYPDNGSVVVKGAADDIMELIEELELRQIRMMESSGRAKLVIVPEEARRLGLTESELGIRNPMDEIQSILDGETEEPPVMMAAGTWREVCSYIKEVEDKLEAASSRAVDKDRRIDQLKQRVNELESERYEEHELLCKIDNLKIDNDYLGEENERLEYKLSKACDERDELVRENERLNDSHNTVHTQKRELRVRLKERDALLDRCTQMMARLKAELGSWKLRGISLAHNADQDTYDAVSEAAGEKIEGFKELNKDIEEAKGPNYKGMGNSKEYIEFQSYNMGGPRFDEYQEGMTKRTLRFEEFLEELIQDKVCLYLHSTEASDEDIEKFEQFMDNADDDLIETVYGDRAFVEKSLEVGRIPNKTEEWKEDMSTERRALNGLASRVKDLEQSGELEAAGRALHHIESLIQEHPLLAKYDLPAPDQIGAKPHLVLEDILDEAYEEVCELRMTKHTIDETTASKLIEFCLNRFGNESRGASVSILVEMLIDHIGHDVMVPRLDAHHIKVDSVPDELMDRIRNLLSMEHGGIAKSEWDDVACIEQLHNDIVKADGLITTLIPHTTDKFYGNSIFENIEMVRKTLKGLIDDKAEVTRQLARLGGEQFGLNWSKDRSAEQFVDALSERVETMAAGIDKSGIEKMVEAQIPPGDVPLDATLYDKVADVVQENQYLRAHQSKFGLANADHGEYVGILAGMRAYFDEDEVFDEFLGDICTSWGVAIDEWHWKNFEKAGECLVKSARDEIRSVKLRDILGGILGDLQDEMKVAAVVPNELEDTETIEQALKDQGAQMLEEVRRLKDQPQEASHLERRLKSMISKHDFQKHFELYSIPAGVDVPVEDILEKILDGLVAMQERVDEYYNPDYTVGKDFEGVIKSADRYRRWWKKLEELLGEDDLNGYEMEKILGARTQAASKIKKDFETFFSIDEIDKEVTPEAIHDYVDDLRGSTQLQEAIKEGNLEAWDDIKEYFAETFLDWYGARVHPQNVIDTLEAQRKKINDLERDVSQENTKARKWEDIERYFAKKFEEEITGNVSTHDIRRLVDQLVVEQALLLVSRIDERWEGDGSVKSLDDIVELLESAWETKTKFQELQKKTADNYQKWQQMHRWYKELRSALFGKIDGLTEQIESDPKADAAKMGPLEHSMLVRAVRSLDKYDVGDDVE